jgi:hypothetical protein
MSRWTALAAAAVGVAWMAAPCAAAPMLSIDGLPPYYVPGQPFTFTIMLTGAEDLASYGIDVGLELQTGTVGTDAWLVEPDAPLSSYVFGDTAADRRFFGTALRIVGDQQRLTIGDLHDPDDNLVLDPVNTVAGVNDLVAEVTVGTGMNLTGDVLLSLDASTLELDTPQLDAQNDPVPIDGFEALQSAVAARSPSQVPLVPEPATLVLLAVAAPWLLRRAHRARIRHIQS